MLAPMDDLTKFKQVKKARAYTSHIKAILKVLDLTLRGLSHFKSYTSVQRISRVIQEEATLLNIHLVKCERFEKEYKNGS